MFQILRLFLQNGYGGLFYLRIFDLENNRIKGLLADTAGKWMVSGAETAVGRYLVGVLREREAFTEPVLFLCAGSDDDSDAEEVNVEGTRRLLESLDSSGVKVAAAVYLSSHLVYSPDAGEGIDESRPTFAWRDAGRSYARAEVLLEKWAASRGVTLTVVRPAVMFGRGVGGEMLKLFNRVVRGHYVHVRGNEAKMSAVTMLDVARAMSALAGRPGIFNVSDGRAHTWLALAEAMTCNAGSAKRMTHLPEKWVKWIYRYFKWVPIVEETMSPSALEPVSRTQVLDNGKVREATGMEFYDTLDVIARRQKDYPYEDN